MSAASDAGAEREIDLGGLWRALIARWWIAAAGLVVSRLFLPRPVVQRAWALPLYTNFAIPIMVLALLLSSGRIARAAWANQPRSLRDNAPAE